MRYVLLIPGWFPSKVNFLAGDFIERHAKAASLFFPVRVLFVVKDNSLPFGKIRLQHDKYSENYESYIYYYSSKTSIPIFEKMFSVWFQSKCLFRGFKKITIENGLPSLIHAHVLVKHAWFALKQSREYHIPLLASEQWTGYLPEAEGEFANLSLLQKKYIGEALGHAVHVTAVSEYLALQMRKRFSFADHTVIPNLVDTSIFQPQFSDRRLVTFIHISTLSRQKNFDDIIEACKILKQQSTNWQLNVVAPYNRLYEEKVSNHELRKQIIFRNEIPHQELSTMVAQSDALILYSNYETFGCVIVEANACGVPVIVSELPVFNENVQEGITGFKVPLLDAGALADRMLKIINKQHSFSKEQIITLTKQKYSVEIIGKQFAELYNQYAKP